MKSKGRPRFEVEWPSVRWSHSLRNDWGREKGGGTCAHWCLVRAGTMLGIVQHCFT